MTDRGIYSNRMLVASSFRVSGFGFRVCGLTEREGKGRFDCLPRIGNGSGRTCTCAGLGFRVLGIGLVCGIRISGLCRQEQPQSSDKTAPALRAHMD